MSFYRNPEIKKIIWICSLTTVLASIIGLAVGTDACIAALSMGLLFTVIFLQFTRKRYEQIARLSKQLDQILHGEISWHIEDSNEGELSILQLELCKMIQTLRHQSDTLKNERIYLSDSLADISHQMKTPLTSMRVIASLLRKSDLSESRRLELIGELIILIDRMDWLIATLLKISRIDANTVQFQKERVLIPLLLSKALEPLAVPMDLRGQVLVLEGEETAYFWGDLFWSAEAMGNIVKNCMEHTPDKGTITIRFYENPLYSEIIIRDNGTGIAQEDLPHVFERFYRGRHAEGSGVGIGLALARMIINRQNGTIKVENNQASGSTFIIRFYKGAI